jgi:hypothetical protein
MSTVEFNKNNLIDTDLKFTWLDAGSMFSFKQKEINSIAVKIIAPAFALRNPKEATIRMK